MIRKPFRGSFALLLVLFVCLRAGGAARAQTPTDSLYTLRAAGDTLPEITMKFEPAYLILWALVPGFILYNGGHSYAIDGDKKAMASRVLPYFRAAQDPALMDLYKKHRNLRITWYSASTVGGILFFVGFIHSISGAFGNNSRYVRAGHAYLLTGTGIALAGTGARIAAFRTLRRAVDLYNYQHAAQDPAVSLHLGLPSAMPAGVGLYVKF